MDTQNCYNCKYYMAHYVKQINRMRKIDCGHCTKTKKRSNIFLDTNKCKHFELLDKQLEKEQQKEYIEDLVASFNKKLTKILETLTD